jgi:hypothetical protein
MDIQTLKVKSIRRDGGTQPRADLDDRTVGEYADLLRDGAKFPPVEVYYDGKNHWLYSGFHRCAAHELLGWDMIDADVKQGTQRNAQWASFAANKEHGLRRQPGDVKRSLYRIFADDGWKGTPHRTLASHLGCARSTVAEHSRNYQAEKPASATDHVTHNKGKGRGVGGRKGVRPRAVLRHKTCPGPGRRGRRNRLVRRRIGFAPVRTG